MTPGAFDDDSRMSPRSRSDLSQPLGRMLSLLGCLTEGERSDAFRWLLKELIANGLRPEGGHTPESQAQTLGFVLATPSLGRIFLDLGGFSWTK